MATYRYRLKFLVHIQGAIFCAEKTSLLSLSLNHSSQLSVIDAKVMSDGTEFVLSAGGFENEAAAYAAGAMVKDAVMFSGAVCGLGIDVGKDRATLWLNPGIKADFLAQSGVEIKEDVHGLCVYKEDHPISWASSSPGRLVRQNGAETLAATISRFIGSNVRLTNKQRLALELYGASYFEKSERARFLTLVLGAESLSNPQNRSEKGEKLVCLLVETTSNSEIDPEEKKSILGSLSWLYKQSVSQSLRNHAREYLVGKTYNGMHPWKFIAECYDARSTLVHSGSVDPNKVNIGSLAASLETYLADLIIATIEQDIE